MCIASLLNRCYLQVSGSVRVRRGVVGRLGLALGLQLGIGIGFRRNHSWSSTFTPRRNHSLCLNRMNSFQFLDTVSFCNTELFHPPYPSAEHEFPIKVTTTV